MNHIALQYLGSGYDVCGEYADGVSVKKRLFDLSKVPERDLRQIPNPSADYFSVKGESYEEYQSSLTGKVGLSTNYGLFSASVESSFSSTELSISESSYVSIKLFMRYETWKLQSRAQEHMYPEVIEDFKNKDGKWLIEQYGAAVVTGMDIGGQWSDNFSVSKLYENSTSDVSVSMEAAYGSFVSGNGSAEIEKAIKREESIATRRVNVIGGDPKYAPGFLDDWQASVEANPAFMNFTSDGLVWVWDLFPEHKDKLEQGLDEYVKDHELNISKRYLIQCQAVEGYQYARDRGSGADDDLDLYKPATSDAYKYVGVNGNSNDTLIVKELSANYGAIREPDGWQQVWNDRGSGNTYDYSCWIPIAPPGYIALGVFCRFRVNDQDPPSRKEAEGLVVVHKSLVEETGFSKKNVWKDKGSGANHDLTLGRLPHNALWPSHTTDPKAGILPTKYTIKGKYMA